MADDLEKKASPPVTMMSDAATVLDGGHALEKKQKICFLNYATAVFAGIGSFLFGYDSGIIGSVISANYREFHNYFDQPKDNVTGAIVSVFAGGAFFGAIVAGACANSLGRKRTIQLGSLIAIVGCTIQTAAVNIGMLIAGRAIAGLAIGVLSMIVPLYQAEISPPHARGLLSGWTQLQISFGFFIANWVGYGCQNITGSNAQWRVPLGIQIVPAVLLLLGMFILPYSPRWLVSKGRHEEARAALFRLHGSRESNRLAVEAEFAEIDAQVTWERENLRAKFSDLWATKASLHRTACACLVQICCQFSGVNVNAYYSPLIYAGLGYTGNTVLLITGISGAWSLVITFIFIQFLVDRIGRRAPLIYGAIGMSCMLAWQAGVASKFANDPTYSNSSMGIAGIASIFLFSGVFSLSYGPVSWTYQSEVFSMPLRAMGTATATASNWASNVVISQITPHAFKSIGYKYFFVFVATNLANAVIAYFLFPETKHLSLEEMSALFGDDEVIAPPQHLQVASSSAMPYAGGDVEKAAMMTIDPTVVAAQHHEHAAASSSPAAARIHRDRGRAAWAGTVAGGGGGAVC